MLEFFRGKASDRKLRLFAVACDRCGLSSFLSGFWAGSSKGIEVVERYADGHATVDELARLENPWDFRGDEGNGWSRLSLSEPFHTTSAAQIAREVAASAGHRTTTYNAYSAARNKMANVLASLLRDIFGNPFRPIAIDPSWLTPTVKALAESIYTDRTFDQLPLLADELVKSGCANPDILDHCRGAGVHVRGCCVVDGVLRRE